MPSRSCCSCAAGCVGGCKERQNGQSLLRHSKTDAIQAQAQTGTGRETDRPQHRAQIARMASFLLFGNGKISPAGGLPCSFGVRAVEIRRPWAPVALAKPLQRPPSRAGGSPWAGSGGYDPPCSPLPTPFFVPK